MQVKGHYFRGYFCFSSFLGDTFVFLFQGVGITVLPFTGLVHLRFSLITLSSMFTDDVLTSDGFFHCIVFIVLHLLCCIYRIVLYCIALYSCYSIYCIYCIVLCCIVLYCIYRIVLCCIVLYLLYCIYRIVLYCIVLCVIVFIVLDLSYWIYRIVLHCIVFIVLHLLYLSYWIVLHCIYCILFIVLFCIALHCFIVYCIVYIVLQLLYCIVFVLYLFIVVSFPRCWEYSVALHYRVPPAFFLHYSLCNIYILCDYRWWILSLYLWVHVDTFMLLFVVFPAFIVTYSNHDNFDMTLGFFFCQLIKLS